MMDPKACFSMILSAARNGRRAEESYSDLMTWVNRGGFKPRVSRADFETVKAVHPDVQLYVEVV